MPGLPTYLIIGAMKAGTTSLHHYLRHHPQIYTSRPKELRFFAKSNWHLSVEWYQSHFDSRYAIRGETSPIYTRYPEFAHVPQRIHSIVPEVKLIYLIRHPVDRAFSQFVNAVGRRVEDRSLNKGIFDPIYVAPSMYYMQLEQYLQYFPQKQILVVQSSDLLNARIPTLRRVFEFIGADPTFESRHFNRLYHKTASKRMLTGLGVQLTRHLRKHNRWRIPVQNFIRNLLSTPMPTFELPTTIREQLLQQFDPDIKKLAALTGRDFQDWYR